MIANQETRAKEIVNWLVSKNHRRVRAWEQNLDFQRLLARIYVRAEEFALAHGATVEDVIVGDLIITPNYRRMTWTFGIKDKKDG